MDPQLKADLEELRSEGEKFSAMDVFKAEHAYEAWAERLFGAILLVDVNMAQKIKSDRELAVHERIHEDIETLKSVLETR